MRVKSWKLQVSKMQLTGELGCRYNQTRFSFSIAVALFFGAAPADVCDHHCCSCHCCSCTMLSAAAHAKITGTDHMTDCALTCPYCQPAQASIAALAGACFWYLGGKSDSETAIYSTLGALLVASLFLGILNSIFVQPVIASERQVFYRERAAGMYDVFPWYLGMVRPSAELAESC